MSSPGMSLQNSLTGLQKAAIVLLSLGPTASAGILKQLSDEEVDRITASIAKLDAVTSQQTEAVLGEFQLAVSTRNVDTQGGLERTRAMLTEAFGEDHATRLVDRIAKTLDRDGPDFSNLRRVDPQQLAKFIQDEHPQTIALVLSHLDPSQAAALIAALPVEKRSDIAVRMASLEQISPEAVRTIATVIGQKLRNLGELSREACGGVRAVADMLNRLDPNNCSQLLDTVEKENPELFESVRRFMFVFDDLAGLDASGFKELVGAVDRKVLMIALKGTSEELKKRFTESLSQRGAEMMKEDMAALGPVKIKEVDAAQQQIITLARQLEKDGTISLKNSPAEQYIN
ncbi:MAG: flagellar motor switch protein FliG [Acidobacteriia bacterium]|nr:flagellar motor switch protein FliG [Terriglobia bacterium]